MERSPAGSVLLFAAGAAVLAATWAAKGVSLDINAVIFAFPMLGILLHGSTVAYPAAMGGAARHTGSMMLEYPLYGGIMGLAAATFAIAAVVYGATMLLPV